MLMVCFFSYACFLCYSSFVPSRMNFDAFSLFVYQQERWRYFVHVAAYLARQRFNEDFPGIDPEVERLFLEYRRSINIVQPSSDFSRLNAEIQLGGSSLGYCSLGLGESAELDELVKKMQQWMKPENKSMAFEILNVARIPPRLGSTHAYREFPEFSQRFSQEQLSYYPNISPIDPLLFDSHVAAMYKDLRTTISLNDDPGMEQQEEVKEAVGVQTRHKKVAEEVGHAFFSSVGNLLRK